MESAPNPPEASTLTQQDELLESIPVEPKAESADQKNDASKSQESSETLVKQTENKAEAVDDTTAAAASTTDGTTTTTAGVVPSTDDKNPDDQQAAAPLSKKALKRQKRWDHKLVLKKRRKEHTKEAKRAQAVLDGRDMDDEKRDVEERTKDGEGHRRREKLMMDRIRTSADKSFQVCLDCSFEEHMVEKEVNSLSSQIRYCYATNKRSPRPVYLSVTSLAPGPTRAILEKVDGFPEGWVGRGFELHTESMEEVHDKSKLVYLTSDSPNVLDDMDNDKIYVIGGIVDRNRLKRATIDRANVLGIATAKLPIQKHLELFTTKVLTCNHVFDIMLKYRECGKDWKKAMLQVLPERKDVKGK